MNLESLELEPEPGDVDVVDVPMEDAAAPATDGLVALTEVLGADVPLPDLIKWVPDTRLRDASAGVIAVASMVDVTTEEGFARADAVLADLRGCQKAIEEHFKEPTDIAHRLHKRLTSLRGEWLAPGTSALSDLSGRLYTEHQRRQRVEAEARRQAQEEADRLAREAAAREAAEAEAAAAPAPIVEDLKRQAQTATAAPVAAARPAPRMASSATQTTWKVRCASTTGDREPNPDIALMNAAERMNVVELLRWILEKPDERLQWVEVNWRYGNARAKADQSTLQVPGLQAFAIGSLRGKGGRR